MPYLAISAQDPLLRQRHVNRAGLIYRAAQLQVPAVSFGDTDPLLLDLPDRKDIREWPATNLNLPDVYRLRLTDAVVHPPFGVITIGGYVLQETLGHIPFHLPGYARHGDEVTIPVVGVGATLDDAIHVMGGNYANHFHLTVDILPKLQIEPFSPCAFDGTILFPPVATAPLREMIMRMALTNRSVCSLAGPHAVHVRSLLFVPNLAGFGMTPNPGLAGFFDNLKEFLGVAEIPNRRVYVTRGDSANRILVNEEDVIATVERAGFEIVNLSGLDLVAQARVFASASHIIAPHGAGLSNLVFCSRSVAVCELHMDAYLNWCCRRLGGITDIRYGCLVGTPGPEYNQSEMWVHSKRWSLALAKIEALLADSRFLDDTAKLEGPSEDGPSEKTELTDVAGHRQGSSVMNNDSFFGTFFPQDFWDELGRGSYPTSDHSLCTDGSVFSYLIGRFRPETIIEVGSWHGHSANFMADASRALDLSARVLCVDTFMGSVEHWGDPSYRAELHREGGRPAIYERFVGNTLARGNGNIVFPLTMDSRNAALLLADFHFQADLIYIDGAHDYESVASDIARFFPLLSSKGLMFGDDYQWEPVAKAVHEFALANHLLVFVSSLKWIFATPAVTTTLFPSPSYELRNSRDGWVPPW